MAKDLNTDKLYYFWKFSMNFLNWLFLFIYISYEFVQMHCCSLGILRRDDGRIEAVGLNFACIKYLYKISKGEQEIKIRNKYIMSFTFFLYPAFYLFTIYNFFHSNLTFLPGPMLWSALAGLSLIQFELFLYCIITF